MNSFREAIDPGNATRLLAITVPDTPIVARAIECTPSIGLHKENEVALCTMGIRLDWGGWGYDRFPAAEVATILQRFPRLQMKQRFSHDVCRIVEARPDTTCDNFARDFGERFVPGNTRPSTVDLLMNSPFKE